MHDRRVIGVLWVLGGCSPLGGGGETALPTLLATRAETLVIQDADGDRFVDASDGCPNVPGIYPHGCPDRDVDGDGFLDSVDRCKDEPGVEPDGCPIPDSDGDGIVDPDDRCLKVTEVKNGYLDEDGCADEIPVDLVEFTGTIKGIKFELDKDILRSSSKPVLARAIAVLQKYPEVRIEISGHTDSTGMITRSEISARRARAVKKYLVEHGVLADRIESRGAGPDEPVDTNKTAAGRAKNRRIEFTILVQ